LAEDQLKKHTRTSDTLPLDLIPLNPVSLLTIRMQEIYCSFASNYVRLLNEMVFCSSTLIEGNRKIIRYFKNLLQSYEANTVLSILWRESEYVTEDDLAYDSHSKLFLENPLTTYRLAVHLSPTKNDVAATNSRVRLIVKAGLAFGLVEKRQLTPTNIHIFGTELLHNFMARLGLENANSCAQVIWQDPDLRVSPHSLYNWERYLRKSRESSPLSRRVRDSASSKMAALRGI
jgi:hypothetical protein